MQEQILSGLRTQLLLINGVAPYNYAVTTNHVLVGVDITTADVTRLPKPCIAIGDVKITPDNGASAGEGNLLIETMRFALVGFTGEAGTAPEITRRNLWRLQADMRHAIWNDTSLGGLKIVTLVEGVDLFNPTNNPSLALVSIDMSIQYEVDLADLTNIVP